MAIARALAKNTPIVLADEPTGNLDHKSSTEIIELLNSVAQNKLVIVVTHNPNQFSEIATREINLCDGEILHDIQLNRSNLVSNNTQTIVSNVPLNKRNKVTNLIKSDLLSDFKNTFSFISTTTLVMLIVLILGSIFMQFSIPYNEGLSNTQIFATLDKERIILKKDGNEAFTSNELNSLKIDKDFTHIVENDIFLDLLLECKFTHNYGTATLQFYANTIESNKISIEKLSWGRLPIADNEVIMSADSHEMLDDNNSNVLISSVVMPQKTRLVKIVGGIIDNTKYLQTLYFTNKAIRDIAYQFADKYSTLILSKDNIKHQGAFTILISNDATTNTIYITKRTADLLMISDSGSFDVNATLKNVYYEMSASFSTIEIIPPDLTLFFGFNIDKNSDTIIMSHSDYAHLVSENSYQISLFMKNPSLYKDIIKKVEMAGYIAYYPYIINEGYNDNNQVLTLFWIFLTCLFIGVVLIFLSLLLLRNSSKTKVHNFAILESLGYKNQHILYANIISNIIKTNISIIISLFVVIFMQLITKAQTTKSSATYVPYANLSTWFTILTTFIIGSVYVIYFALKYRGLAQKSNVNQKLKGGIVL
ncbi:MAG: hypothetical protein LBF12_07755 [Christensenellaceae bacterium]|nr:hypothetical protein [Christensenellaceae bacterium]